MFLRSHPGDQKTLLRSSAEVEEAQSDLEEPGFILCGLPSVPLLTLSTCPNRRNTSVDENYEWDSEFPGDMELLETWHQGLPGSRSRPELEPELGR